MKATGKVQLKGTVEKGQIKYFAQNQLSKITFFYVQTVAWLSCCSHKLRLFKFVETCKGLFTI